METYFRITSYALVATAFLALALTGQLDVISMALYAGAIVLSFVRDRRARAGDDPAGEASPPSRWRAWAWRALVALYLPFLFFDATLLTNRVLALVHLALFASAVKLLQPKRDRDWVFLYVIAFFMMLLSAGLTFNATFVGSLALFLFFFVSTLAAFEVRRAQREIRAIQDETIALIKQSKRRARGEVSAAPRRRVRYLLGASFAQVAIVAALTLPFFFLIPRFGGGVAQGFADTPATGFSDRVELGQVARIKKSQQVVMRVQLDRNPGRYLRWRGVALEYYDGHVWSLSPKGPKRRHQEITQGRFPTGITDEGTAPIEPRYLLQEPEGTSPTVVEQKIILEPLDTLTLFAAQRALRLRGPIPALSRDLLTDALSTGSSLKRRTAYSVWSDVSLPTEQQLRADTLADLPEGIARLYLQLPDRWDHRIARLAHDVTRNAPTPYDKAKAIETYLRTQFEYTLDLTIDGEDPLADFLFEVRKGHCEYFASAMVVMLRTLDIPARLVNGFQMGEYNEVNRMFTVRESDAHSWVEVYFPHAKSWVEFDPTPAAGINDYSQGGLLARVRKYMDAMEVFWLDYIVTLDSDEQASIIVGLQRRLAAVKDRMMDYYNGAKLWTRQALGFLVARDWRAADWLKLAGLLLLVAMAGATLYVLRHLKQWSMAPSGYGPWWHRWFILPTWKRRRLARRDGRECAVMFYEQMLAIASRAGLRKPAHQTPMEFAAASGSEAVREITHLYNRVRFGGAALDEAETRRVSRLLAELKHHLRKK